MASNRTYLQASKKIEDKFMPKFARIIRAYRKSAIEDLRAGRQPDLTQPFPDDLPKTIEQVYRIAGVMGAKMTSQELKKQAQKAAGFGRNERWIRLVMEELRLNMLNILSDMTETMRADILRILQKAVDEGWGIDQIVKELQLPELIEARARLIARTEINKASNAGHKIAAQDTPYEVDKGWSAAKDHRTRHSHQKVNGQWIDENGKFKVAMYKGDKLVGWEEMDRPGDPDASAGNVVNCRCRVLFRPKRDSAGRLIMRNPNQATIITMPSPQRIPAHQIAAALKANIKIGID